MVEALPPRAALDDVGIDGTLREHLHITDLLGLLEEDLPELASDEAPLLLGVAYAGKQPQVALLGMHVHQWHVELFAEDLLHHLGLTLAQKAMVHKDAGQLIADSTVYKCRHHRGVHSAGKGQDDLASAHLLANLRDLLIDDVVHGPTAPQAADAKEEVLEHGLAAGGVTHLGVELRGIEATRRVLHGGDGTGLGGRGDREARRHVADGIAMAHPHGLAAGRASEDAALPAAAELSGTVLALLGMADLAAQLDGHDLLPVAEAQDGNAQLENTPVHVRRIVGIHGGGATR